ncbi:MAG: gliding motility-associated C-terminal domain-containing protein [Bacteroidales bacterium]|nr:gliding motility-associated C-terminal domain-containing protein [Bacteroidales bacterium]
MRRLLLLTVVVLCVYGSNLCAQCVRPVAALDAFFVKHLESGDSIVKAVEYGIDTLWNTNHTSYTLHPYSNIDICLGDSITLIAKPTQQNGTLFPTNQCNYTWNFGDGTTITEYGNPRVSHRYTSVMGYNVTLTITNTNGNCTNTNNPDIRVRIAGNPIKNISSIIESCDIDTLFLSIGYAAQSTIQIEQSGFERTVTEINQNRVFIPDGPYCEGTTACYEAPVVFSNFTPDEIVDDVSDIVAIYINMEHSYLGDLDMSIICPNGSQVFLKYYPGGVNTYLGVPLDSYPYDNSPHCDSNVNPYGIGWTYGFSNQYLTNARGVLRQITPYTTLPATDTVNNSGYYQTPNQTGVANTTTNLNGFSPLIGCPLNGEWKLRICDHLGLDNGWVFYWYLNLTSGLQAGDWSYSVPVDSVHWTGSYIGDNGESSDTTIAIGFPTDANGYYPYNISVIDAFGCVWDTMLQVQVFPSYDTTIEASICDGTYSDFGFNADTSGTYIRTLQTTHGCDSIITLNLIVAPVYDSFITAEICHGEIYSENGFTADSTGTYTLTKQTADGCDSIVTLYLSVRPSNYTQIVAFICANEVYDDDGFYESSAGQYTLTLTNMQGCDSIILLDLRVNPIYDYVIYDTICAGTTYNANGFNVQTSGTYHQYLQTTKGCDSTITLYLEVKPSYDSNLYSTLCYGETYNQNGFWADTTGIYSQTFQTIGGCDSTITLYLLVNQLYDTTIYADICAGEIYSNNGFYQQNEGLYHQYLQSAAGCDSTVHLNLKVNDKYESSYSLTGCFDEPVVAEGTTITSSGDYKFTYQSVKGCDSVINVNVHFINPTMQYLYEREYATEFPIWLDATCDSCSDYLWSNGQTTPLIEVNAEGMYYVSALSPCGEVRQMVEVRLDNGKGNIFVPNAFTPNANSNTYFKPYGFEHFEITFEVYNRYGAVVYSSNDQNEGWDGNFKGKPCPQGVYAWKLLYRNIDNPSAQQVKYGTVMLVR